MKKFFILQFFLFSVICIYSQAELSTEAQLCLSQVLEKYKPSVELCIPPVNKLYSNDLLGNERFQIACLVAGMRSVVITEKRLLLELFNEHTDAILAHHKIKMVATSSDLIYDIIIFHEKAEKSALILLKSIVVKPKEGHDYLWGYLLEYGKENIKFFYQLFGFFGWLRDNGYEGELPSRGEYAIWPQEFKDKFQQFEEHFWHSDYWYNEYKKDKKAALDFIDANQHITVDDLVILCPTNS